MKALLLAAGFGTRLQPLTLKTPKCLVEIKGVPLLEYWINNLYNTGINDIIINTHYLNEKVELYLKKYSDIQIVNETNLLGTCGTIINNIPNFNDEDVIVIHADNFTNQKLIELIDAHKNRPISCLMTMMVFRTNSPSTCGIVELDKNNIVSNFFEKVENPPGNLANAAVYVLSREMINELNLFHKNSLDFSVDILPKYLNKIFVFETKEFFIDIGTPENYKLANEF